MRAAAQGTASRLATEARRPDVEDLYSTTVKVGAPARLLITGENIWRSTEVLLGGQAAFSADTVTAESMGYLVDRYKAAPSLMASLIKHHTAACLDERISEPASAAVKNFFGDIMVYTVRNIEKDRQAFISGYRALAERDGPATAPPAALGNSRPRTGETTRNRSSTISGAGESTVANERTASIRA